MLTYFLCHLDKGGKAEDAAENFLKAYRRMWVGETLYKVLNCLSFPKGACNCTARVTGLYYTWVRILLG